jgi:tetratricopeptide (TPR) repeat protein
VPTNYETYVGRSGVYLMKEDYNNAIADLQTAMESNDTGKDTSRTALSRIYERRGEQELLKKNFDQAITSFTEAIGLTSPDRAPYTLRADAYAAASQNDFALKDYSEAIRVHPDDINAYLGRGQVQRALGAPLPAIADFGRVLEREPSNVTALMLRALTREDVKDQDGAISDYQAVLKLNPRNKLAKAGVERVRALGTLLAEPDASDSPKSTLSPSQVRRAIRACCIAYCRAVDCNSPPLPEACSAENLAYYIPMGIAAAKENYMAGARNVLGSSVSIPECED